MAETNDFELQAYAKIWELLEASQSWSDAIPEGNRIRYDNNSDETDPEKEEEADGDFPKARLVERAGSDNLFTTGETFGTYSSDTDEQKSGFTETGTLVYRLILVTQVKDETEITNLCKLSRDAIRQGGPKLGLSFVTSVKLRWEVLEVSDDDGNVKRITTNLDIYLEFETNGNTLLEE